MQAHLVVDVFIAKVILDQKLVVSIATLEDGGVSVFVEHLRKENFEWSRFYFNLHVHLPVHRMVVELHFLVVLDEEFIVIERVVVIIIFLP